MAYAGKVFSFDHNWTSRVKERLGWKTTVITKRSGLEQRIKLRSNPRRELEYSIEPMDTVELQRLQNLLWSAMQETILVPIWTYAEPLPSTLASGSNVVPLSTPFKDYDSNAYLLFYNGPGDYEAVAISSLTSSQLNLSENTVKQWAKGTPVTPARLGRFAPRAGAKVFGSDQKAYEANFAIDESKPSSNRVTAITPDTYRSRDLFLDVPESSEDLAHEFEREQRPRDAGTGLVSFDPVMPAPWTVFEHHALCFSIAELSQLLGFLDRRKGRLVPFWMPSWDRDFDVSVFAPSAGQVFRFSECGYTTLVNTAEGRRDVYVHAPGNVSPRSPYTIMRLTSATNNGDGTEQALVQSVIAANNVSLSEAELFSYLKYCRLEADTVELSWDTPQIIDVTLTIRELFRTA